MKNRRPSPLFVVAVVAVPWVLSLLTACQREERRFRELSAATEPSRRERLSDLRPGPKTAHAVVRPVESPYDHNAFAITEGKRLFDAFNCSGCHSHGGGGMGPPLMDDQWIYGSQPENIYATIVEGRPNGMPAFAGRLQDYQVWRLVAYVRSMGRLVPKAAASGRSDHMYAGESEQAREAGVPVHRQEAEHPQ
jgi:cytochrome c oxidase cbb3-type subunit 3